MKIIVMCLILLSCSCELILATDRDFIYNFIHREMGEYSPGLTEKNESDYDYSYDVLTDEGVKNISLNFSISGNLRKYTEAVMHGSEIIQTKTYFYYDTKKMQLKFYAYSTPEHSIYKAFRRNGNLKYMEETSFKEKIPIRNMILQYLQYLKYSKKEEYNKINPAAIERGADSLNRITFYNDDGSISRYDYVSKSEPTTILYQVIVDKHKTVEKKFYQNGGKKRDFDIDSDEN